MLNIKHSQKAACDCYIFGYLSFGFREQIRVVAQKKTRTVAEEINNEVLIINNKTDTSKKCLLYLGIVSISQPANS
jgi:hypothetical protein